MCKKNEAFLLQLLTKMILCFGCDKIYINTQNQMLSLLSMILQQIQPGTHHDTIITPLVSVEISHAVHWGLWPYPSKVYSGLPYLIKMSGSNFFISTFN